MPERPRYAQLFARPILATALMAVAAKGSYALLAGLGNSVATVLAIGIAVVVYGLLVIALRAISKDDLALMPKGEKIAKILRVR